MASISVDVDPQLLERARVLTRGRSDRSIIDLALRRLVAAQQKGAMIDGVLGLGDPQREDVVPPP